MARILLADNDPNDLREWSKLLQSEGHDVVLADSPSAADAVLRKGALDLAILDLHMETMSDSNDLSGLRLAERYYRSAAIILLTGLVPLEAALQALSRYTGTSGASLVYGVCLKKDGPKPLLEAIEKITAPKVFLSHGRDLRTMGHVKAFLEAGGIKVIVLRDNVGQGQTIFQIFDQYSHVDVAVVLVTPDDVGALSGEELRPRARQNVIFELGFFLGKLDRNRVITLCEGKVDSIDFPSNYDGFYKIEIDPGDGWRIKLVRALDRAGIRIDVQKAILR